MTKFVGASWIESNLGVSNMSNFGREVADLLGDLFGGIYHQDSPSLRKVDWSVESRIELAVYGPLSTFDNDLLTRFVLLCHERCIRGEISAAAPKYLRLTFTKRYGRDGDYCDRHPDMETAIAGIRDYYERVAR
jgi:hypothetical protein